MTTPAHPIHVLVVDDEKDMCWVLRQIIQFEGHTCAVAHSALEALQAVAHQQFALAFVDVKLPDIEGVELVERIRRIAPTLPCVLVSGFFYDDDQSVQESIASGLITGFIGKPFILTQVQDVIRTIASKS